MTASPRRSPWCLTARLADPQSETWHELSTEPASAAAQTLGAGRAPARGGERQALLRPRRAAADPGRSGAARPGAGGDAGSRDGLSDPQDWRAAVWGHLPGVRSDLGHPAD